MIYKVCCRGSCVIGRLKYYADHIRGFPVFITLMLWYSCDVGLMSYYSFYPVSVCDL